MIAYVRMVRPEVGTRLKAAFDALPENRQIAEEK
jgi:hypothetical protein